MAIQEIRICDVHGTTEPAVITLPIDVEGQPALVDLCAAHKGEYDTLLVQLAAYHKAARPIPKVTERPQTVVTAENQAIREWGRAQGEEMPDRGRISDLMRARYLAEVANQQREPDAH